MSEESFQEKVLSKLNAIKSGVAALKSDVALLKLDVRDLRKDRNWIIAIGGGGMILSVFAPININVVVILGILKVVGVV